MTVRKFIHDRSFWIRQLTLPAIWVLLHLYAGRPLVIAAAVVGVPRVATWIGIVVIALSSIVATRVPRRESFRLRKLAHGAGYFSMSLFSILFVLVLGSDLLRYLKLNRELLDVSIACVGIALALIGLVQARYPAIRKVRVPIESLPADLHGFRIVQLSDVHIGPTIQRRFVRAVVKRVNALAADAVVITGDLVDGYLHDLRDESTPLRDLDAREGVFYVTGNHEYYWRASEWMPHLTRLGLRLLKNEHEVIRRGDAEIAIAGVTDPVGRYTHKQDLPKALHGVPRRAIKVLLSHRPQTATAAARSGVHLQLSGHTHGGQFFPFNLLIRLFQPIVAGLHRVGNMWLYVNRGTGYWGPPSRLGVGGEITVLELASA